ncbi:hypothetical protein BDM02DRAFT_3188425 [Thelephora ganbajun]|uniref:Uncharacterized protein n=1 Tax=Thelephora ganbajun TaxID=370292 RepID=A0ACB6ZAX0_THEGA|nr:hypothetical protein BDM02DRAFT_3188425 [Thelephora ganbajun]
MSTSGATPVPPGPDPRTSHHDSPSPPQNMVQASPAASSHGSTRSSLVTIHKAYERVKPTATIKRYDRTTKLKPPYIDLYLDPIQTSFADGEEPRGWIPLAHPDGALYWVYNWREGQRVMPVYTDAYLYNEEILGEVENFRDAIFSQIKADRMPAEWELVLDLGDEQDPNKRVCCYYFVNHTNRTLFWLHQFDTTPLLSGLRRVKSKQRIQQALESFYWNHWEMFPHDREVPEKLLKELVGIMVHAGLDDMTSQESTSVYTGEELQKLISYMERIKFVGGANGYSAFVVGRLMGFFTHRRYVHFFGQREAHLNADQSIYGGGYKKKRTWLIRCMSLLMLSAPGVYLEALNTVYTDFVVCQRSGCIAPFLVDDILMESLLRRRWNKFICKVQDEWRELVWIGNVLLITNVVFLAIPSVDGSTSSNSSGYSASGVSVGSYIHSPAQVTSFMSIIFCLGCIASAQSLLGHQMIRPHETAEDINKYLHGYYNTHFGLEKLAILYSLPHSLLLWAVASFFAAFIFAAFVDTGGKWQRYPTAVVIFIVILLLIWCDWRTSRWNVDSPRGLSTPIGRGHYVQPDKDQPEQHDSQETTPFKSVHVDPNPRSD